MRNSTSSAQQHSSLHIAINGWFVDQPTAGIGQYTQHLLTHLPQLPRPVRLSLLLPSTMMGVATYPGVTPVQINLPRLPRTLRKLWWEQVAVPRAAQKLGADLLWIPYWAAPAWQPCPVSVTIHDLIPMLLPLYRGGLQNRLYTALVRWTAQRSTSILTISHTSAQDITKHLGIPSERVHVVYHGPNHGGLPGMPVLTAGKMAAVRARYNLPERYFLYLGGFDMRKNVESTLAGYAHYLAQGGNPAVKLVLAGKLPANDSHITPDPRRQATEQGVRDAVTFCGLIDEADKAAIYAQAVAFVFPSLYEGFGMMLLEAMAAGTPVITSG